MKQTPQPAGVTNKSSGNRESGIKKIGIKVRWDVILEFGIQVLYDILGYGMLN